MNAITPEIDHSRIEDAVIDANLGNASPPELVVYYEDTYDEIQDRLCPCAVELADGTWLGQTEDGLRFSWTEADAVYPPADTSPKTRTEPVSHRSGRTEQRVQNFSHVACGQWNDAISETTIEVRFKAKYPHSRPIALDVAKEIVAEYVNGDRGSDTRSHTWLQREVRGQYSWNSLSVGPDKDGYIPYNEADYGWVKDSIRNAHPKRTVEIDNEQTRA